MKHYNLIISGGTFDHFHSGHKAFLKKQLEISENILLGITSDEYTKTHKTGYINSYEVRKTNVQNFLKSQHALGRVIITAVSDEYISALWEKEPIEAIVVTKDTIPGAEKINRKRVEERKLPLVIEIVPTVLAEDGNILSASRIRNGEISRDGKRYINPVWLKKTLVLPQLMREALRKPVDKLYPTIENFLETNVIDENYLISIGDIATKKLHDKNIRQKVSVVDLLVRRKKKFESITDHISEQNEEILSITNPASHLTPSLFQSAKKTTHTSKKSIVFIDGEEDLAVLPFTLAAPLHSHILYGQPDEGVGVVTVTEEVKKRTKEIVEKFDILASKETAIGRDTRGY